jgi:hypothetical protein
LKWTAKDATVKIVKMNHPIKMNKNLRAIFVLGLILALLPSISGGYIFAFGYLRAPGTTMQVWEFGKFIMICGLANLFVYVCLFFQIRKYTPPVQ